MSCRTIRVGHHAPHNAFAGVLGTLTPDDLIASEIATIRRLAPDGRDQADALILETLMHLAEILEGNFGGLRP